MIILNGKKLAQRWLAELKKTVANLQTTPILAIILVGDNQLGKTYIQEKEKTAGKVGIGIKKYFLPDQISQAKLIDLVYKLNKNDKINGILIQLPLPKGFDTDKILNSVEPKKDVDGLGKNSEVKPPTVAAILGLLKYYKISLKNRKICLVGCGRLVGKPLAPLLKNAGGNLTICNTKTKNLSQETRKADIIITAAGAPHLIRKDMVKKGAVVVDAGTAVEKAKSEKPASPAGGRKAKKEKHDSQIANRQSQIVGDVDFKNVKKNASYITPPVGGVGPLTVAKLLKNLVKLAR